MFREEFRSSGDRRQETGDRRQETGDRRQETGDRRQETGDRRQETGDRRQETGDRRHLIRGEKSGAISQAFCQDFLQAKLEYPYSATPELL